MKKILAVDLDEVLSETIDEILKFHHYQVRGIPLVRSEISDYHLHKITHKQFTIEDDFFVFDTFFDS
jgi:5'(3')-deoxyribonucleotidase